MDSHTESAPPEVNTDPRGTSSQNRPPLRRVRGVLGGVAAGIAEYLGTEAWVIRVAFFLLCFAGGFGFVAYLAGWLLIPELGSNESIGERWFRAIAAGPAWIGVALIVIAVMFFLGGIPRGPGSLLGAILGSGLFWAALLLVAGVLIYQGRLFSPRDSDDEIVASRAFPSAPASEQPAAVVERAPRSRRGPRPPRPSKPRSNLGRFTIAAVLVGVGVLALLQNAGAVSPGAGHYFAVALAIVGIGLIVGTFWGRSRGLIALGLVLAFAMGISVAAGSTTWVATGPDVVVAPASLSDVQSFYQQGAGQLTIDLTNLPGTDVGLNAQLGSGELTVILPSGMGAVVNYGVGVGSFVVQGPNAGQTSQAFGVLRDALHIPGSAGTAHLDLNVGAGQIVIIQEATP